MTLFYTKDQVDNMATLIGTQIKNNRVTSATDNIEWKSFFENSLRDPVEEGLRANYPGTGWYKATDTGTVFCKDIPDGETHTFDGVTYTSVYTKEQARALGSTAAVSNVTSMESMFSVDSTFNQDISSWDVSNVTSMAYMFQNAYNFNQDIGNWDVANVTNMSHMFYSARGFNQDISGWNVGNVTDMTSMFNGVEAFNQDLSWWNVLNIPTQPDSFDQNCFDWVLPKPVWGIDGTPT